MVEYTHHIYYMAPSFMTFRLFSSFFFFFCEEHFYRHRWKFPDVYVAAKWTNDKPTYQLHILTFSIRRKPKNEKKQKKTTKRCLCVIFSLLFWIGYKVNIINRVAIVWIFFLPHWIWDHAKSTLIWWWLLHDNDGIKCANLYRAVGRK